MTADVVVEIDIGATRWDSNPGARGEVRQMGDADRGTAVTRDNGLRGASADQHPELSDERKAQRRLRPSENVAVRLHALKCYEYPRR